MANSVSHLDASSLQRAPATPQKQHSSAIGLHCRSPEQKTPTSVSDSPGPLLDRTSGVSTPILLDVKESPSCCSAVSPRILCPYNHSDHFPVGAIVTILTGDKIHKFSLVSYNVLDKTFNNTYLSEHLESEHGIKSTDHGRRKDLITSQLATALKTGKYILMALQEHDSETASKLERALAGSSFRIEHAGQCTTIYNPEILECERVQQYHWKEKKLMQITAKSLPCQIENVRLQFIKFKHIPSGSYFHFFNLHVPNNGKDEFRHHLIPLIPRETPVLFSGDFNIAVDFKCQIMPGRTQGSAIISGANRISSEHPTSVTFEKGSSPSCRQIDHILLRVPPDQEDPPISAVAMPIRDLPVVQLPQISALHVQECTTHVRDYKCKKTQDLHHQKNY